MHKCFAGFDARWEEKLNDEAQDAGSRPETVPKYPPSLNIRQEDGKYYLVFETGPHPESWEELDEIFYCPFCGKKLASSPHYVGEFLKQETRGY